MCFGCNTPEPAPRTISEVIPKSALTIEKGSVVFRGKPLGKLGSDKRIKLPNQLLKETGTVVILADGRYFVIGGTKPRENDVPEEISKTYILDGQKLIAGPDMSVARRDLQVLKLRDGRLLLAGGITNSDKLQYTPVIEFFDPKSMRISPGGRLIRPRVAAAVLQLSDGRIIFAGGQLDSSHHSVETASIELYDPKTRQSKEIGDLVRPSQGGELFEASPDKLVIVGGLNSLSEADSDNLPPELISLPTISDTSTGSKP
ncbi:MAG: hypothetical protein K2X77_15960 [Candidatus Obscuribacterales bacterium]|jgi:hypothetical protein|nr:hypothetical protein [Candidatus Obscuribacterales bacterium]